MRGTENSEGLMTCIASKEGSVLLAMYGIGGVVARALPGSDFLVRGAWQAATSGKPIPRNGDSLINPDNLPQLSSTRLIVCSFKFVVDPTYVLRSRILANRLSSRQVKHPGTPFKISPYRIRDLLKVGTFVFAPFKRRAGVHFYLLLLPSRYNTNTVDALFYLQRHKIKGTTSSGRLLFFCFLLPPFSSIPTELAIQSALRVLKIYTYRLCNANVIYPPIVHISSPWHIWYTYKGHTTELV